MNETVSFENLSRNAMQLSAEVIMGAADLVFLLWPDGQIAEVTLSDRTVLEADPSDLKHRDVREIVQPEDADKLAELVDRTRNGHQSRPIKLRHSKLIKDGTVARYSAHLAGDGKNVVLFSTAHSADLSLSAQAAEAEIARNRREDRQLSEARYRLLFEASGEGLLVADRASGLIEQANGNAASLLGRSPEDLIGTHLWTHFAEESRDVGGGEGDSVESLELTAQIAQSGLSVHVSAQAVWSYLGVMLIVRLNRIQSEQAGAEHEHEHDAYALELLRKTSVPVFLSEPSGKIAWCNGAFAALVGNRRVLGSQVADILSLSQHALDLALEQADRHGRTPTSLSSLDSRLAISDDAHLTIVSVSEGANRCHGFLLHFMDGDQGRAEATEDSSALADLVGKAPLKKLVRRSTDVIERDCILAALRLTGNNRAAAASVLGLSRQSLYLKIREHKLG